MANAFLFAGFFPCCFHHSLDAILRVEGASLGGFSAPWYQPRATSRIIITAKPAMVAMVTRSI